MKKIHFAVMALSIALFAVPAFATDDASLNFHALSGMVADTQAPTVLSDEQLAAVEGGEHLTAAINLLRGAAGLARLGFLSDAQTIQIIVSDFLFFGPAVHACGGGVRC